MSLPSENVATSLILKDLDYIDILSAHSQPTDNRSLDSRALSGLGGAYADTAANAYTTGNIAYATATATAIGSSTRARTISFASVQSHGPVTISRAHAISLAIARNGNHVDASASADASVNVSFNR